MKRLLKLLAVASAMVVGGAAQAGVTVIDLFDTPQAKLVDNTVDSLARQSQVGSALDSTILGGYRELFVNLVDNDGNPDRSASIGVNAGVLDFNVDSLANATGIIRWDGSTQGTDNAAISAINPTGLGGVDIGNALTDSFELKVVFADGQFRFVIEAFTDANSWSKVSLLSNEHPVPATTLIPLAAFLDCGYDDGIITVTCAGGTTAVDFDNLGALQVVLDPNAQSTSIDLTLNQVTVVPEPGTLALAGLAVLGLGASVRRRKA